MKKAIRLLAKSTMRSVNATTELILKAIKTRISGLNVFIDNLVTDVEKKNSQLTDMISNKIEQSTKQEADAARDTRTRGLFHITNALTYSAIAEESECAMVVMEILDNYGLDIIKKSYSKQTADTNAILSDLDKPEVAAVIDKVPSVRSMVEELRSANEYLKQSFIDNVDNKLDNDAPSASKISEIILDMVNNDLIPTINTMSKISPDEYLDTYKAVSKIAEEHNQSIKNYYNRNRKE
ncbi:MAG: DUF6261 family protein [Bacteroidales bacterium]|jgi:hypothetical protein|nr:DUF6261 family protein [Bacteroidales bacterium]